MICGMTTVHVRANQTTVDWAEGAEFVCERTPFVDNLIQHGGLTEIGTAPEFSIDDFRTDPSQPYVTYRDEEAVADTQVDVAVTQREPVTDDDDTTVPLVRGGLESSDEPASTKRPRTRKTT